MKKLILSAVVMLGLALTAQAQDISKNALGLRLGDNDGFGGEISYQRGLSKDNRLEFGLGWNSSTNYNSARAIVLYQWVWNIDGGFNWYAGAGGGVGSWRYKNAGSGTYFLVAGDIGVEYNFDKAPIQLSLDFRPEKYFAGDGFSTNFGSNVGLGIRYKFD